MNDPSAFNIGAQVGVAACVDHTKKWSPEAFTVKFGCDHLMKDRRIWLHLVGGNKVGDTLRVLVDRSREMGLRAHDFVTQWFRNGKAIPGENDRTYVRTEADIGQKITVNVYDACFQTAEAQPTLEPAHV